MITRRLGDRHAQVDQNTAVGVIEHAACRRRKRKDALVHAHGEHDFGAVEAHAIRRADGYFVQPLGDHADVLHGKHEREQLQQALRAHAAGAHGDRHLVEQLHHLIPHRAAFDGFFLAAALVQRRGEALDVFIRVNGDEIMIQFGDQTAALGLLQFGAQRDQRRDAAHPQGVQLRELLPIGFPHFAAEAGRVLLPFLRPSVPVDLPERDVILQFAGLFHAQPRQLRFEQAEHRVGRKASCGDLQRGAQEHGERLGEQRAAFIVKHGDALLFHRRAQRFGIAALLTGDHGDLAAAVPPRTQQLFDGERHVVALVIGARRGANGDRVGRFLKHFFRKRIEKLFQFGERRRRITRGVRLDRFALNCDAPLFGGRHQPFGGGAHAGEGADIVIIPEQFIGAQRDKNVLRLLHHAGEDLHLLFREALEAVDEHQTVGKDLRFGQPLGQQGEPITLVKIALRHQRVIGARHLGDVP